jgi:predicted nuclease with TOPRIM domain
MGNKMNVSGLKKDRLLQKCELLMVRGVDSASDVSEQLNVSYNTAKSYIEVIRSRWQDYHTVEELQAKRKELIKKTEAVISESWELKNKARNVMEATSSLRTALMAIERLQKLHGIDDVPPQPELPKEAQISQLADSINTTLSLEAKQIVINSIKKAISLQKKKSKPEII